MEIGQIVMKICGRDSGQLGVIIEKIDDNYVLIDGNVRRKKCNVKHLEAIDKTIEIKEKTGSEEIKKALEKEGIKILKKGNKKEKKERIKKKKISKKKTLKEEKGEK